jgi:diaminopimelate epimerase
MALHFEKYEGLGNDFVIIEAPSSTAAVSIARARELCDRRLGIGADGVLLVLPAKSPKSDGTMMVINADGSVPEMCGNGLRCVALHVARKRQMKEGRLTFDTDAGLLDCKVKGDEITIDMGVVRWVEDVTIDLDGKPLALSLGNAGNPHAILLVEEKDAAVDYDRVRSIGPRVEKHSKFPQGTNVEFTVVRSKTVIDLVVWERGVGITQACGTGACATVAVAVKKGWADRNSEVTVNLPGGALSVTMDDHGHAIMRGPARHVFSGSLVEKQGEQGT